MEHPECLPEAKIPLCCISRLTIALPDRAFRFIVKSKYQGDIRLLVNNYLPIFPQCLIMAKIDPRKLSMKQWHEFHDEFWKILHFAIRRHALEHLLDTFLTASEHVMVIRRMQIAKFLLQGFSMEEIRRELRVGLTTIMLVDRMLRRECCEYRMVFGDLLKDLRTKKRTQESLHNPFSFASIRKKYPAHFVLFTMIIGDQEYLWNTRKTRGTSIYR